MLLTLLTRRSRITWLAILISSVLSASSLAHLNSENPLDVPHDLRPNQDPKLLEIGQASKLQSPAKSPAEIKVISYNIRWRGGDDLRKLIELLKHDREIGGSAIIGLQEVDRNRERTEHKNTVKLIAETLGFYYAWTAPPATKAGQEEETGVAILSSYPLADIHRIILPHEGPGGRRRVALGATVAVTGARIRVYSIHSENRISVARKMDQTKAVLTDLAQYPKDMPAIILGDLNTWEPDAVDKTSKLFPAENFSTPFDDDQATFSSRILIIPIKLKLDWIWLRGLEATSHGIDEKIDLSDHWPLWVVVKMRQRISGRALFPKAGFSVFSVLPHTPFPDSVKCLLIQRMAGLFQC